MLERYSGATRLYPVVGDPIAQVKSPYGVTQAFEQRGRDAICVPMQISGRDYPQFMATMRAMKNCDGVIVTIPHKFAAFAACDSVSDRARFLQSVNTIRRQADGSFHGDMFDGLGFVEACRANGARTAGKHALLVGVGGAGTAIAHALASGGLASLTLCDIDHARRNALAQRLQEASFNVTTADAADPAGFDIVCNATPLGMRAGDPLPIPVDRLRPDMFVGCVVTKPEISPLIAHARAIGCTTSTGGDMFVKVRDLMIDFLLGAPA